MPSLAATARATITSRARLKVRRHAIAAAAMVVALHPCARALPQGAMPTFGQASVSTQGAQMTIVQGSHRAGIDWRSFSLGTGEGLNIVQPSANAILVNRVVGTDPSLILGNLRANGRVFLSNPRGVVFGKGSMVDVGSLVATTLNLSDAAMLAGRFELQAADGTPGELTQDGSIVASGTVALVAPGLTQLGSIQAPRIGLAAAERVNVDVEGDGLIFFNVGTNNLDTRLRQLGQLQAGGGGLADIRAQARSGFADTVLNLDGVVQARGVTSKGGRIYVDGGTAGITTVRGTLDANSAASNGTGGSVTVLGDKVGLFDNAALSASGPAGGGQVLVGGNWQGQGPERNAQMTHVAAGARIDASATGNGDGGKVVVWADKSTHFDGEANARGGAASGDGGSVEVSGKSTLDFHGSSDRRAPRGQAGLLLLDPTNLTINNAANTNVNASTPFAPQASGVSTLSWATLLGPGGLGGGAVAVTTVGTLVTGTDAGDITVAAAPAGYNSANALTLTTAAGGAIIFNAPVSKAGTGALNLNAGTGGVQVNAAVTLTGGNLSINSNGAITQTAALSVGGTTGITAGANAITLGNLANNLTGAVSLNNSGNNNVSLVNTGATVLSTSSLGSGTLTVTSGGPLSQAAATAITQAAGAGTASFNVGANAITLVNAGNNFTGAVALGNSGANAVALRDTNAVTLGASTVGQNLSVTAGGNITQAGALVVPGTSTFTIDTATNQNVALAGFDNSFTGAVNIATANGGSVQDLGLRNINAAAAVPTLPAGLRNLDLQFTNAAITIPTVSLTGTLNVLAGGAITQAAGGVQVAGTAGFNAGANAITLNEVGNNFAGAVALSNSGANAVALRDTGALQLGSLSVGSGTLTVTSGGPLTQVAATAITQAAGAGTASFSAGANAITLSNAGNNFTGAVALSNSGANAAALRDSDALQLGDLSVGSGTLTVTSGGPLTQAAATAITQAAGAGTASFNVGANAITLANAGNNFTGAVALSNSGANAVALRDSDALQLGDLSVGSGTLTVTSGGPLTQAAATAITQAAGAGAASFSAGANAITLANAGNNFTGAVSLSNSGANAVALRDTNAVTLGASTVGQNLSVTAGGNITQAGALVVPGTSTFTIDTATNQNVALAGFDNNFTGAVNIATANGGSVQDLGLRNINAAAAVPTLPAGLRNLDLQFTNAAITMPTVSLTGTLNVLAGGAITQAAGGVQVAGTAGFNAGANAITLNEVGNNFAGAVALSNSGANAVALRDTNAVTLGASTVGQNLAVTAGGNITQAGALVVPGTSTFTIDTATNQNVALAGFDNNFTGAVNIATANGGSVQDLGLRNINAAAAVPTLPAGLRNLDLQFTNAAITIPTVSLTGTLNVLAGGAITQAAGGVQVAGTAGFNAGANAITLNEVGNNFAGAVALSNSGANAVALRDTNAVTLGASTVGQNLSVTAGGNITQAGALVVPGTSTFTIDTATNQNVALAGFDNNFTGAVNIATANGGSVQDLGLRNINAAAAVPTLPAGLRNLDLQFTNAAITIPTVSLTGTLNVLAGGAITQAAGGVQVAGTAGFNAGANAITLNEVGNNFAGAVALSNSGANAVALRDTGALQLGSLSVGSGTLTVTSGGPLTQVAATAITQAAGAGTASFSAGANAITLSNAGNNFTGAVSVMTSGSASIRDTSGLTVSFFGTGSTTAQANNALSASLNGTGGTSLTGGSVSTSGGSGALAINSGSTTFFGGSTVGGNLSVSGSGAVTQAAALTVSGTTSIAAGAGAITLENLANSLSGAVSLNNGGNNNVSLVNNRATVLGASNIGAGTLSVSSNAAGSIRQTGAVTQAASAGAATFTAGANVITLDNAGNDFTGAVTLTTSASASIRDSSDLMVSFVGTGATTGQATGALVASLASGGTSLIGGSVSTSGNSGALTINSGGTTQFGTSAVAGNLSVSGSGAVTQAAALAVSGTTSITSGAAKIELENTGNSLTGAVSLNNSGNNNVSLVNNRATVLGATSVGTGTLRVSSNAAGSITQTGAVTQAASAGAATFTAGANAITLGNLANSLTGAVSLNNSGNNNVSLVNNRATVLGASSVGTGTLSVSSNAAGSITQTGGVTQAASAGAATFTAGANAITLGNLANSLTGAVSLNNSGNNNVSLMNNRGTVLGASSVGTGTLSVSSNAAGSITQTGAVTQAASSGAATFTAGANAITLDNAGNDFNGAVALATSGSASIRDSSDLKVSFVGTGASTGRATGALVASLASGGTSLTGGSVSTSGSSDALTINSGGTTQFATSAVNGDLTVNSAGAISQAAPSDTLVVTGSSAVTIGSGTGRGSTTLDNVGNNFGGALGVASNGTASIRDLNALSVSFTGTTTTTAVATGALSASLGGTGGTSLTGGSVSSGGSSGALTISSGGTTQFGASDVAGNLSVSSAGTVTQSAAIHARSADLRGNGEYLLLNAGNALPLVAIGAGAGAVALVTQAGLEVGAVNGIEGIGRGGATVALRALAGDLTLASDATASSLALLASGSVRQTGGVIQAAALSAKAQGGSVLLGAQAVTANAVGVFSASASGDVLLKESDGYEIGAQPAGALNVVGGSANGSLVSEAVNGVVAGSGRTIELNTGSGPVTQTQDLAGQSLLLRGAAAFELARAGNTVNRLAVDVGGGVVRYANSDALTVGQVSPVVGGAAVRGVNRTSDVSLRAHSGTLNLASDVSVGAGSTLRLQAAEDIVQSAGTIAASALGAQAGGSITLPNTANQVTTTVALKAGGNALLGEADGYNLGSVAADGALFPPLVDGLQANTATGTAELNVAAGTVTQTQAIRSANLLLRGAAAYALANTGNNVATLAADTGSGVIRYLDSNALTVGTVRPVAGGTVVAGITRTADVSLIAAQGDLALAASTDVGNAATLRLQAATGGIVQTDGKITAAALGARAGTSVSLVQANEVFDGATKGVVAGEAGGGSFKLVNTRNTEIAQVTADGALFAVAPDIRAAGAGNDITLAVNGAGGDLTLATALHAGTTGTVRLLAATGSVAQTDGAITAGALGVQAKGNIALPNTANQVSSTVALKAGGSILLGAAAGYNLGSVAADGALFTPLVDGLQAGTATGTAELNTASGTVTQTQAVTAGKLLLRGDAGYDLANTGNNVATLAGDTGDGVIRFLDSNALTVGAVTPVAGGTAVAGIARTADVSLHTVLGDLGLAANTSVGNASTLRLQAVAGSITQTGGAITAGTLGAQAAGSIALPNVGNQVTTTVALKAGGNALLGEADGHNLGSVAADGTLFISLVDGLQANTATGTAELNTAAGTVTQTQAVTAGKLLLRGAAAYALANTGNNLVALAADTGGGVIRYLDSDTLTVDTVTPVSGGTAVAGIARTADVSLHTVQGNLTLARDANVGNAGTLRLQAAAGSITQTGGAITTGTLGAQATGNINLPGPSNQVASTVALKAAGSVLLGAAAGYNLGSVAADGTLFTPQVDGLQANTASGTAELNTTAGTVTQTQAVTAARLLLRGAASYALTNAGNSVQQLAIAGGGAAQPTGAIDLATNASGDRLTLKPLKGDLSQQDYAGLERLGNLTITTGGAVSFAGAFNANGGVGNLFTIRSTQTAEADPVTFKAEVDTFVSGLKAPLTEPKLFSPAGREIDTVTGAGKGDGANGLKLEIAKAVIDQVGGDGKTDGNTLTLAGGVTLRLESAPASGAGGSIVLANDRNSFIGGFITARSASSKAGGFQQPKFELDTTTASANETLPLLSRVEIHGSDIRVGDSLAAVRIPSVSIGGSDYLGGAQAKVGIEADLVRLTSLTLTTDRNHIMARYSANKLRSFEYQLPGLVLTLGTPYTTDALGSSNGDRGAAAVGNGPGLKAVVGYSTAATGSVGWMVALPGLYKAAGTDVVPLQNLRNSRALVSLSGPVAKGLYSFASPDTVATIPIYYNLDAPLTPAQRDALGAIDNLSEKLRREQIERSVSTENVARDLREGVIVEVGAGPAATTGSDGIRLPKICPPAAGGLSCSGPVNK